jgi:DNA-binding XRE family transcriptional regulator
MARAAPLGRGVSDGLEVAVKVLTSDELLALVRARVMEADSQAAAALQLGISKQLLSKILREEAAPGLALAKALGYKRVVMYTKEQK